MFKFIYTYTSYITYVIHVQSGNKANYLRLLAATTSPTDKPCAYTNLEEYGMEGHDFRM